MLGAYKHGIAAVLAAASLLSLSARADDLKPLTRISPEFPREATAAGADKGHVKARVTIDASGEVSHVEIIEANPRRVFDRAVMRSLSQWRYPTGAEGRTTDIDVDFQR
jgi:TonB family protein